MPGSMLSPVLIGRAHELEILHGAQQAVQEGAGRCILLAGEAGIGKSRLAAELCDHASASQFLILQGHCSEQDRSYPYASWIDALRTFLAPQSTASVVESLGPFTPELVKLLPELSLLLPSIQPSAPLDPAAEKHRLFESLARFIIALAAARPLLIVLEDLHWSDEQSLEFLHFFARRSATVPILILGTYRSEDPSPRLAYHLLGLYRERLAEEVQLSPLTRREVSQMAQAILHMERPINPGWLDMLMRLSEGNPFYVEEMVKDLARSDALSGNWDRDHLPIPRIPRSIQQTVQRRVEELPDGTRHVLALASVIGERFDFALLREVTAVTAEDEQTLLNMLHDLIAAQLIIEQSAEQFGFRHALTREVVYATLMLRERKAMHRTIGETLERFAGTQMQVDGPATPPASLAYHFYEAGEWQKAMEYAQLAGEKAQALYAPREALVHFTRVVDAARQLGIGVPLSVLRGRAQAFDVLGEFDRARADYEAVLELARCGADRVDEWRALIDLGFLWQSRDLERAGEYYQHALELARNLGDASVVAPTLNRIGNWYLNRGRAREGLPFHREALQLFREAGDRHGMAQTMDLLGLVSYQIGEAVQGAAYLEQAAPILRELDDRQGLVNTLANLTTVVGSDSEVLGEINIAQLVDLSEEASQIAAGFRWYQGEVRALIGGAIALRQAGEYSRALAWLSRAQPLAEEIRHRESLARVHNVFGEIFIGMLALPEARDHLETALALAQALGSGIFTLFATGRLAIASILQRDFARAKDLLDAVLPAEYPEGDVLVPHRRCWSGRAQLELALGHPSRALEIVDHLLASAPNLAQYGAQAIPSLSHLRGQALAALRRMDEAETELPGALAVARRQGQVPLLWRLHADLGKVYRAMGRRDDAEQEFSSARTIIQDLGNNVPEGALRDNFLRQALAMLPAAPTLTPRQSAKKDFSGLTAREHEIAVLIAQGKSNRGIADELVVSEKTVERHVANILLKLGFHARTQIAAWAVTKGLDK